jgi:phosphoglucomutase
MEQFRNTPPESFGGRKVIKVRDYLTLTEKDLAEGTETGLDFPSSNVLQFITEGDYLISARPSGTEPKIKFYISVNGELDSPDSFRKKEKELDSVIERIKNELNF